jgi:hypothetical protein
MRLSLRWISQDIESDGLGPHGIVDEPSGDPCSPMSV